MRRPFMQLYPVISSVGISEVWHGEKMTKELPDNLRPPMIKFKSLHWYTGELIQLNNGAFFIPLRWLQKDTEMHAQGHMVDISNVRVYLLNPCPTNSSSESTGCSDCNEAYDSMFSFCT
jgi:hypothetical protein